MAKWASSGAAVGEMTLEGHLLDCHWLWSGLRWMSPVSVGVMRREKVLLAVADLGC